MRLQIFILLLSVAPMLYCADSVRFVALERQEERSKLLQIRQGIEDELLAYESREKRIAAMEAKLVVIPREKNVETRIIEYLMLRRRVQGTLSEIKASNARQLELAGMIDASMTSSGSLPQVADYLADARGQLRNLGQGQGNEKKRLEQLAQGLRIALRNIPAPREYTTENGVKMRLVQAGDASFYISSEPLRNGDVTMNEAMALAAEISRVEGARYKLPDTAEMKILSQRKMFPKCAVWSGSKLIGKNIEQDRIFERFGVSMYMVWDHANAIGRGTLFGELPEARYPGLGCYVTTALRTGWQKQWNKVLAKVSENLEGKAAEGGKLEELR